ncbi:hypothetical protein [Brevifollis gellanilyticus]|uniref:Lipoprotein n=1 Tax=Brevifollis gellanilyticus TaxID=748831 RepID=A0A512M5Z9_9BACT|nr:hypothetical protein [Brevifollis gellanilyticus]GEP42153.1 hypothetical protein BGE01nite_14440 [Brevifollis gellanilyticus]
MKTKLFQVLACVAMAALLTSCPETTVPDNFGATTIGLKPENAEEWEGSWHPVDDPKEVFVFHVTDAPKGLMEIRDVPVPDPAASPQDPPKPPNIYTLMLRDTGVTTEEKLHFAIVKDTAKPGNGTLYLVRYPQDGVCILWGIDHEAVSAAITSGEIQGLTKRDKDKNPQSALGDDPADYPKLLSPKFWKWTEPAVLVKIKK